MSARAIWKGVIHIGEVSVPVRLYSAVEERGVDFRLLHEPDLTPVKQRMINPETEEEVPRESILRGYEAEEGLFVVVRENELARLEPEPSRDIEILAFVERDRVSAPWFERPYWLGPDGSDETYFALTEALGEPLFGIARWTMRKRRYVGALHRQESWLMLSTLRHVGEVLPRDALGTVPKVSIDPKEAKLAEQLVAALEGELDLSQFHDEHRERVQALIDAKAKGKRPKLAKPKAKKEVASLEEALKKSLASMKKEKRVA